MVSNIVHGQKIRDSCHSDDYEWPGLDTAIRKSSYNNGDVGCELLLYFGLKTDRDSKPWWTRFYELGFFNSVHLLLCYLLRGVYWPRAAIRGRELE